MVRTSSPKLDKILAQAILVKTRIRQLICFARFACTLGAFCRVTGIEKDNGEKIQERETKLSLVTKLLNSV